MKLYLAGIVINVPVPGTMFNKMNELEQHQRNGVEHMLESYHYIHKPKSVETIRREGRKIFLDSGAFSAFTQGIEVDLPAYCDYIHQNEDIIEQVDGQPLASVLDAIGDCDGTWRNQMEMERRGVRPLPCFHYGEPEEALKWYVERYSYITIGGMVPISTPQLRVWLDRLWKDYLTHPDGTPKVKVHGFGLTSLPLMMRYPWYSVDSSTWVQWGANGMILLPTREGGGRQIDVSSRSSRRKVKGQHLDSVTEIETEALEKQIRDFGVDPDRLRDVYYSRWMFNAWAFPYYARSKEYEGDKFIPAFEGLF